MKTCDLKNLVFSFVCFVSFVVSPAFATPGDFDADGACDLDDFALLAADWQHSGAAIATPAVDLTGDGTVDLADLAAFGEWWLYAYQTLTPPTATAVVAGTVTYEPVRIPLVATDDGRPRVPGRLRYQVISYPTGAQLHDPTLGAGLFYARHVPWTLSSWGSEVLFWTEHADTYQFSYRADDGGAAPQGGPGDPATVTVTVTENPRDHLAFDGRGQVTFADHAAYDPASGWAVSFYFRTIRPSGGLISKRGTEGAGWQIDLVNGRLRALLFDADDDPNTITWPTRLDDGQWRHVVLGMFTFEGTVYLRLDVNDEYLDDGLTLPTAAGWGNDQPVVLGRTAYLGYSGDLDKLRFFTTYNPASLSGLILEFDWRQGTTEQALGFGAASAVRFKLDEGTGTTVTDDKQGLTGTISDANRVRWRPFFDPYLPALPR
jgi:hypothetical protein